MDRSTEYSPAIDVGPKQRHAVIAFVLALLSVPGSTLAWDLPAGGLWIGLPLAVVAIVLGMRARRAGQGTGLATAAIVIAGLMIAQMAVWTVASLVS
jgi:hypothetical protein